MLEISQVNGVEKIINGNTVIYLFNRATVSADSSLNTAQVNAGGKVQTFLFSDITEKYGTSDIIAYFDYLATNNFFLLSPESEAIDVNSLEYGSLFEIDSLQETKQVSTLLAQILFELKRINA